jgi:hypothetical protein
MHCYWYYFATLQNLTQNSQGQRLSLCETRIQSINLGAVWSKSIFFKQSITSKAGCLTMMQVSLNVFAWNKRGTISIDNRLQKHDHFHLSLVTTFQSYNVTVLDSALGIKPFFFLYAQLPQAYRRNNHVATYTWRWNCTERPCWKSCLASVSGTV